MNEETLALLDLLAKGTAVLLFGLGGITCMRRYSAAQRSLVWLAVFAALLVLPLAAFVQPVWTLPVTTVKADLPLEKPVPAAVLSEAPNDTNSAVAPTMSVSPTSSFRQYLGAIYITGVIAILAFRFLGALQLHRLKDETTHPGTLIQSLVNELREKHLIHHRMEVFLSDRITVPMTWGTLTPVLLLPADSVEWSSADLQTALEHELAHIRHRDAARRWLATLVSAFWWPHPLVWVASKAWRLEQERACDDAVVRSGANPERYAQQLLHAANALSLGSFPSADALVMAMPSGLETRLISIIGTNLNRSATGRLAFAITSVASLCFVTICAVCQAQTEAPAKVIPKQIKITTKFVQLPLDNPGAKHPVLQKALTGTPVTLRSTEMEELWRQLAQKRGIHLMSAPVVTTHSGQKATVQVVREFIYPIAFEQDSDKPTAFDMAPVGVTVHVEPVSGENGVVQLVSVEAIVLEFLGYLSGARLYRLPKDKDTSSFRDLTRETNDQMSKLLKKLPPDARESKPIFSTRKWSGDVSLQDGQWLVSYLMHTDDRDKDNRGIWFFESATEVKQGKSE